MKKLFLYILILFSSYAFSNCEENLFKSIKISDNGASEYFESLVVEDITKTNSFLSQLITPIDYEVKLLKEITQTNSFNGAVNSFGEIRVAEYYSFMNNPFIKQEHSRAIINHEYGHEVFAQNISRFVESLQVRNVFKGRELVSKYQKESAHLKESLDILRSSNISSQTLVDHPDFIRFKKVSKIIAQGLELYSNDKLKEIIDPYDELFADVIAVITSGDPMIISNAVDSSSRDFSANMSYKNWEDNSVHGTFAPFRSFLWSKYLSNEEFNRGFILKTLLESIGQDIDLRMNINKSETPSELNKRLISTFQKKLIKTSI